MSWIRAAITSVLVMAAAFLLLVLVPDRILGLSSMGRSTKVLIATSEFAVALALMLFGLRRLQQRRLL